MKKEVRARITYAIYIQDYGIQGKEFGFVLRKTVRMFRAEDYCDLICIFRSLWLYRSKSGHC